MSIELQDGILIKAPYPADKKTLVGSLQEYASKELIPIQYRHKYMEVVDINTGFKYKLSSDLTTWTQIFELPSWVKTVQGDVTLSNFGGDLDWSRISNTPDFTELDPVVFSVVTLLPGSPATVSGIHPNFTLGIPAGATGENGIGIDGIDGAAATIGVGTVAAGAAGTTPTITNSGTSSAAVFDFVIPAGADGTAATVDAGTTTTGNAGSNAIVTNSGTTAAAIFDFVIPKGDKGDTGDAGADGVDGSGVTILGSDTIANIVLKSGSAGDMWISTTTGTDDGSNSVAIGDGIVYDGVDWLTVGPIRGPQGDTGATGPAGSDGATGPTGADGSDGLGWTGGSYNASTGIVTFSSTDGLGFATGDLRGADGADGADGANGTNGSGVPVGGNTGDLLYKASATDYDVSWSAPTYANISGNISQIFNVNTLILENIEKTTINVEGEFGFDLNDADAITPLSGATAHTGTDPTGLYISDGVNASTVWHTQHFGITDVEGWQAHVDSTHAPSDANNYSHPNHSGQVTSSGDGATALHLTAITGQTAFTDGNNLGSTYELLMSTGSVLRRMDISVLETYMQNNLEFSTGSTTIPAHTGQVLSPNGDNTTPLALHISSITGQSQTVNSIIDSDELLINSRGQLRRTDMSFTLPYFRDNLPFLRNDVSDTFNGGVLTFPYSKVIRIDNDLDMYSTAYGAYFKITDGDLFFADSTGKPRHEFSPVGAYTASSTVTAPLFIEDSDRELKENIRYLYNDFATFNFKGNPLKRYGVIAQDIEKTHTELVVVNKKGLKGVNYTDLFVLEFIKLHKRIDKLESIIHNRL